MSVILWSLSVGVFWTLAIEALLRRASEDFSLFMACGIVVLFNAWAALKDDRQVVTLRSLMLEQSTLRGMDRRLMLLRDENERLKATVEEVTEDYSATQDFDASFEGMMVLLKRIMASYPPGIVNGSSGDPAPCFVVRVREALEVYEQSVRLSPPVAIDTYGDLMLVRREPYAEEVP